MGLQVDVDRIDCVCNGRFFWKNTEGPKLKFLYDEDGYPLCPHCGKISNDFPFRDILAECDTCGKKFKGFKHYPPIAYTCPECE